MNRIVAFSGLVRKPLSSGRQTSNNFLILRRLKSACACGLGGSAASPSHRGDEGDPALDRELNVSTYWCRSSSSMRVTLPLSSR